MVTVATVVGNNIFHSVVLNPFAPAPSLFRWAELGRCRLVKLIRKKAPQIFVDRKPSRFGLGSNLRGRFGFDIFKDRNHYLIPPGTFDSQRALIIPANRSAAQFCLGARVKAVWASLVRLLAKSPALLQR